MANIKLDYRKWLRREARHRKSISLSIECHNRENKILKQKGETSFLTQHYLSLIQNLRIDEKI
jgi:hypothetical protein